MKNYYENEIFVLRAIIKDDHTAGWVLGKRKCNLTAMMKHKHIKFVIARTAKKVAVNVETREDRNPTGERVWEKFEDAWILKFALMTSAHETRSLEDWCTFLGKILNHFALNRNSLRIKNYDDKPEKEQKFLLETLARFHLAEAVRAINAQF